MNLPDKSQSPYLLDESEIKEEIKILAIDWQIESNKFIKRVYKFPDFKKGLSFVKAIGQIAEEENHHPDIHLSWGKVVVKTTTHSVKGLSKNDFSLAEKFDAEYATFV